MIINPSKVYVSVLVDFKADGSMVPKSLIWEDGRKYIIDKVKQVTQAPSLRAGGLGDRYTIVVEGRLAFLFFEKNTDPIRNKAGRWFVERR